MMGFLTIFFILVYIMQVKFQNLSFRKIIKETLVGTDKNKMTDTINKGIKNKDVNIVALLFLTFIMMIVDILKVFYIVFSFKYNINVVLLYAIFCILVLIGKNIRSKINRENIISEKKTKYSVKQMLINLVDLAFFIYMFIILFIK